MSRETKNIEFINYSKAFFQNVTCHGVAGEDICGNVYGRTL